jgi:hypothetical protein
MVPEDTNRWPRLGPSLQPGKICQSPPLRSRHLESKRHTGTGGKYDLGEEDTVTAVLPDQPAVLEASEADLRVAVHNAVKRSGYTLPELVEQARTGQFGSVRARLAWVAIGDLVGAEEATCIEEDRDR